MILLVGAGRLGQLVLEEFNSSEIIGTKTTDQEGFLKLDLASVSLSNLKYNTFIFCVPPSSVSTEMWLKRLKEISGKQIILISSTGVYGENKGEVNEDTTPKPNTENGTKLLAIESLLQTFKKSFVIRPSGLFSKDTHPGNYLAGRSDLKNGKDPVNLISREDVAKVVKYAYENESPRLINLAHPSHPGKATYYRSYCERNELELPSFKDESGNMKIVSSKYNILKKYSELP
jgi:hypothetical protein